MNKSNRLINIAISIIFLVPAIFLTVAYFLEYKPQDIEYALQIRDTKNQFSGNKLKILSWNIGYAGLDENADFFMDGGKSSKPPDQKTVENNLAGILETIKSIDADLILLQEVDVESTRTHAVLQAFEIANEFKDLGSWFATNFKTFFVPVPWHSPIGKVWSGIMTLSKFKFKNLMERYSLPESSKLPDKYFDLKRCLLVGRLQINKNGQELVVVNLHLSAFDNGDLKAQQIEYTTEFVLKEHRLGNLVIAGGDWNHSMPGITKNHFGSFETSAKHLNWLGEINEKVTPDGLRWIFDSSVPTVRSNEKKYVKGENFTTIVDGFLLSPGITVEKIETLNTGFKHSDHEPVIIEISVNNSINN